MITEQKVLTRAASEAVRIKGFDYVEFYVGNVPQAVHFYRTAFGFTPVAFVGLETGERDNLSVVLQQNDIRLLLTSAVTPGGPVARHVQRHGDSVKDIAFTVEDAEAAFEAAVRRGARPASEPTVLEDEQGQVVRASVRAFGDTVHSFIQRGEFEGKFLPNFREIKDPPPASPVGLTTIDHIAVSAEADTLDEWVNFYEEVFDFRQTQQEEVETEYSAMNSKVVQNETGSVKFPIVTPAQGLRRSQVDEYLSFHGGAGAQHIALASDSITDSVRVLRSNGIEFLRTPGSYYDMLASRLGEVPSEDLDELRRLNILVDRDPRGYLLQIFTRHVQSRPTLFWEIIQRRGAVGFGGGNVKALFQAMEREQALRGTL